MGPIHVVMLSSEHHSQSEPWRCRGCTERQAAFLERDLSEAAKPENRQLRPWIVVVVHRPFYNAGRNGLWCAIPATLPSREHTSLVVYHQHVPETPSTAGQAGISKRRSLSPFWSATV